MLDTIKNLLPARYTYRRVNMTKALLGGFGHTSFSESGEDILLTEYLFKKNKRDGFYVDIGAFHPQYLSNTHLLHKRGWHGINVDPNAEVIAAFNRVRPKDINVQTGIAGSADERQFFILENAGASTFDPAVKDMKTTYTRLVKEETVSCVTLETLFDNHLPSDTAIDLLDIDVEHLDHEVITGNNWDKYRPNVILIEDREFRSQLDQSAIFQYLQKQGYCFYAYAHITLILCEQEFAKTVKRF